LATGNGRFRRDPAMRQFLALSRLIDAANERLGLQLIMVTIVIF
jgi:hypothetical protein